MSAPTTDALHLIQTFHERLNARDTAGVVALATDDVEIGGPRGTASGRDVLEDWVGRAKIAMHPTRWFAGDGVVVVEQTAIWHDEDGTEASRQTVATVFRVTGETITGIARYADIGEAVTSSGLDESHEVIAPTA